LPAYTAARHQASCRWNHSTFRRMSEEYSQQSSNTASERVIPVICCRRPGAWDLRPQLKVFFEGVDHPPGPSIISWTGGQVVATSPLWIVLVRGCRSTGSRPAPHGCACIGLRLRCSGRCREGPLHEGWGRPRLVQQHVEGPETSFESKESPGLPWVREFNPIRGDLPGAYRTNYKVLFRNNETRI